MISIEKIAKEANVSAMTVSRVLDPRHVNKVKVATREKVLEICRTYDYSPRYSARSLASGKTFAVGLVMHNYATGLASPTLALVIDSIVKELEKHSYCLNMIYCASGVINEINEKILDIVYSKRLDGFIFFSEMLTSRSVEKLEKNQIPAVVLSMPCARIMNEHISYVYIDNHAAVREAISHLKNIGVKNVMYIGVRRSVEEHAKLFIDRAELFRKEAEKAGLLIEEVECDYMRSLQTISGTFDWILKNWDKINGFDAWIASNDLMAIGALKTLQFKGKNHSKAIVGFDNIEENCNYVGTNPVVTTIVPPHQEMGEKAVALLMEQIQNNDCKQVRLALPSRLVIRDSSRKWKATM